MPGQKSLAVACCNAHPGTLDTDSAAAVLPDCSCTPFWRWLTILRVLNSLPKKVLAGPASRHRWSHPFESHRSCSDSSCREYQGASIVSHESQLTVVLSRRDSVLVDIQPLSAVRQNGRLQRLHDRADGREYMYISVSTMAACIGRTAVMEPTWQTREQTISTNHNSIASASSTISSATAIR